MLILISKLILTLFGLFMISTGFLMLLNPEKARAMISKFASTNFINYLEITLRMILGIAFIIYSKVGKYPDIMQTFGWFLVVTAGILYCVPRKLHHQFSKKSAELIQPIYLRLLSPFAFIFGGLLLYFLLWF